VTLLFLFLFYLAVGLWEIPAEPFLDGQTHGVERNGVLDVRIGEIESHSKRYMRGLVGRWRRAGNSLVT